MQEVEDYKNNDSIKGAINRSYVFENSLDSIEILYKAETTTDSVKTDTKKKKKEKRQIVIPVVPINNDMDNNNGNMLPILIGLLLTFSVLLGILIQRFAKKEVAAAQLLS